MPLSLQTTVAQAPGCLTADVEDDVVVMTADAHGYLALNVFGKAIWTRIAAPRRIDDLCAALATEYAAEDETLKSDVIEFLGQLSDAGLLTTEA